MAVNNLKASYLPGHYWALACFYSTQTFHSSLSLDNYYTHDHIQHFTTTANDIRLDVPSKKVLLHTDCATDPRIFYRTLQPFPSHPYFLLSLSRTMSTLPHPNSLSLFWYRNAGGARVALMGKKPYPREINDYVLDASKWTDMNNPSVNKVLQADPRCNLRCEACDEKARDCDGQACIVSCPLYAPPPPFPP